MPGTPKHELTKVDQIYVQLRQAIMDGTLRPGERLVLRQLAAEYGVSEMPVREAIKRLETEDLVIVVPYQGATVTHLSRQDIEEVYPIRANLEIMAVRLSASRISDEEIDALHALHLQMKKAANDGKYATFARLNREFNMGLFMPCGNRSLLDLIERLRIKTDRVRVIFALMPDWQAVSIEDHEQILAALESRDEARVEAAMSRHKRGAMERIFSLLRRMEEVNASLGAGGF